MLTGTLRKDYLERNDLLYRNSYTDDAKFFLVTRPIITRFLFSREGASDGNGGVEAKGHDPADYILPEKYTYGSGEEYNF